VESAPRVGLANKPWRAKAFYGAVTAATAVGVILNFTPIDPIKALFWSAVINGVVAVPVMIVMMLMTANPRVTGPLRLSRPQTIVGWTATTVMFLVAVGMFATWKS
jgi:Mn2+/Fe2+ NRAMP family transporter